MGGIAGGLLGGGGNSATSSSRSSTQNSLPDWLTGPYQGLVNDAVSSSHRGYSNDMNQNVAGFTQDQNQAQGMARNNVGNYQPYLSQANNAISSASRPGLDQNTFNSYMNPYTQDVTDQIAKLGARNLNENIMPGLNSTFINNGMFGSSRHADVTGQAIRDTNQDILNSQSQALQSGYNNAMSNYQTGQNRQLQGGQALAGLGQQQQQQGLTDVNTLNQLGTQQQQQQQNVNNAATQNATNQFYYPEQQQSYLSGILNGAAGHYGQSNSQTQNYQASPNSLSQILGIGGNIATSYFGGGAPSLFRKKGGKVKKPKPMHNDYEKRGISMAYA